MLLTSLSKDDEQFPFSSYHDQEKSSMESPLTLVSFEKIQQLQVFSAFVSNIPFCGTTKALILLLICVQRLWEPRLKPQEEKNMGSEYNSPSGSTSMSTSTVETPQWLPPGADPSPAGIGSLL